jgi:TonB family protein
MSRSLFLASAILVPLSCFAVSGSNSPASEVSLSKLSPPVYPRLAQQAHISGDVELTVHVRSDGTVESVDFVRGPAMLKQASLDSAQKTQFECSGSSEKTTPFPLTYRFKIAPRDPPKNCEAEGETPPPPTDVDVQKHLVTVYAWELWTCDPVVQVRSVRIHSAKCLLFVEVWLSSCGLAPH